MTGLTKPMADMLAAIRRLTVDGVPPSWSELQADQGLSSKAGVTRLLGALAERGQVGWIEGKARSLYIVADDVAYSATAFCKMPAPKLRELIALMSGILAHKSGGGQTRAVLDRISTQLRGLR